MSDNNTVIGSITFGPNRFQSISEVRDIKIGTGRLRGRLEELQSANVTIPMVFEDSPEHGVRYLFEKAVEREVRMRCPPGTVIDGVPYPKGCTLYGKVVSFETDPEKELSFRVEVRLPPVVGEDC